MNLCDLLPRLRVWQGQAFCLLTELSLDRGLHRRELLCCEQV